MVGFIQVFFWLFLSFPDDYIAIGADCDELGAQIEENILYIECKMCLKQMFVLLHIVTSLYVTVFWITSIIFLDANDVNEHIRAMTNTFIIDWSSLNLVF